MIEATELFLLDPKLGRILLGHKKTGLGQGKVVGIGGHIDPGETPEEAAVREMYEETRITVRPHELIKIAEITFIFPHKPEWSMNVHNYTAVSWSGTPEETPEIKPFWNCRSKVPFERMWDDAQHWLPLALQGNFLTGEFIFAPDNQSVAKKQLHSSARWMEQKLD